MAAMDEKYDSALLGILQSEGKVAPFLDTILGFLYRRTDFFRIMKTETDKLGFPPGVAFKLLMNIFKKYESMASQDQQRIEELKKAREVTPQEEIHRQAKLAQQETSKIPDSDRKAEIEGKADDRGQDVVVDSSANPFNNTTTTSKPDGVSHHHNMDVGDQGVAQTPTKSETTEEKSHTEADGEEKEDPEQARQRRELQANPLTYNGADCDTYFWSQNISEADVRVKVPKSVVKGKQVKVDIRKKKIAVSYQQGSAWSELVNGELEWEVKAEDSMWTLNPGEFVHINLEKKQERWWERVFIGEAGINTRKIDCSRPMTDLDDEAQAKIEEMMYNQRQKQLGLPQSHEVKTHEMLRKAWDAEGSPFKGQPFDPSKFSIDPNGTARFNTNEDS